MIDFIEIIKNITASVVSLVTLGYFLMRYLQKKDIEVSKLIGDTIKDATAKAFQVANIEVRVRDLEDAERKNTEAIKDLGTQLNARLDQLFTVMANFKNPNE
jgi:beta-lactam-binding protein with PASTA domain